jgi:hypothetical protein
MGRGTRNNPYTPDAGAEPPALTGRNAEIQHYGDLIARLSDGRAEQSMILTGLRGVGKTVLLNRFEVMAAEAGWYAETKEIGSQSRLASMLARITRQVLLDLSFRKRAQDRVKVALSVLKAFTATIGEVELRLDVDAALGRADSGDLAEDVRDLLVEVGEAARAAGSGLVLLFDELQFLARRDMEALIIGLHRVKQKSLPVALIGAGLPLLPELTGQAKTYAERMFIWPSIGPLDREAARGALVLPARDEHVRYEKRALDLLLQLTDGYPYFLQEYGKRAWNASATRTITFADAERAAPVAQAILDQNFFSVRLQRLTGAQRRYLSAMASLGDGPQSTREISARQGAEPKTISRVRDELIKDAILYSPERGLLDFTVPHCADYIRRVYPFEPAS